jgi:hypothetical protein
MVLATTCLLSGGIFGGYWLTVDWLPGYLQFAYTANTIASAGACALFVRSLLRNGPLRIVRVVVFAIFYIGYYVQCWWIILDDRLYEAGPVYAVVAGAATPDLIAAAYQCTALSFFASAVLCTLLDLWPLHIPTAKAISSRIAKRVATRALFLGGVLTALILPTMWSLNIGVMGAEQTAPLSFRLAGWCIYGIRLFVPALLLLAILSSEWLTGRTVQRVALAVYALGAIGDLAVTTSKATVIVALLRYVILMAIIGRLNHSRLRAAVVICAVSATLFPFIMAMRWERASGIGVASAIDIASRAHAETSPVPALRPILMRFTGFGELLPLLRAGRVQPGLAVSGMLGGASIGAYTTVSVFGYGATDAMGVAPGLLGWLYVATGETWLPLSVCLVLLLLEVLWRSMYRSGLWSRPVALALIASLGVPLLIDGVFEDARIPALILTFSIAVLEGIVRLAGPGQRQRSTQSQLDRWGSPPKLIVPRPHSVSHD